MYIHTCTDDDYQGENMIVSVLNQKGGVGKTTLAINLAYCFKKNGSSVLLVDSDPQGSARNWHAANDASKLDIVGIDRPTIDADMKNLKFDQEWIFIDGVPQVSVMASKTLKCSDIILIPVQPSPYDVWASHDIVDLIKDRQIINPHLKAAFIISRNQPRTKLGKELKDILKEYGLPVFEHYTTNRVIYAQTASRGETVIDSSDEEAIKEITEIMNELKQFSMSLKKEEIDYDYA